MYPEKMKAAVVKNPGEISIEHVDTPRIEENEVLIKVKSCGICGTDYSIFLGNYSRDCLPLIAGHEFSGVVAHIGPKVKGISEGDPVTADINLGCGSCFYCSRGQKLTCPEFHQLGIHVNGAFAEYVKAPADQVHQLPENMNYEVGAFIEPVSCTIHASKTMEITLGSSVVVLGDGALGILHTQLAKLRGAAPVILVGMVPERLEAARTMGVDYIVDITKQDALTRIKELTGGRGADYVIEAVGTAKTYEEAFRIVRPGGRVAAFGITGAEDTINVKPFDFVLGELSMVGSCAGVGNDWPDAIALLQYGRIDPRPLFSLKIPLEDLQKTLQETQTDRSIMKIFVSPEIDRSTKL